MDSERTQEVWTMNSQPPTVEYEGQACVRYQILKCTEI